MKPNDDDDAGDGTGGSDGNGGATDGDDDHGGGGDDERMESWRTELADLRGMPWVNDGGALHFFPYICAIFYQIEMGLIETTLHLILENRYRWWKYMNFEFMKDGHITSGLIQKDIQDIITIRQVGMYVWNMK